LPAGNRTYRITSLNPNGESTGCPQHVVAILTGTTNSISFTWTAVSGATSYRVYNIFAGVYFTSTTNSFIDTGAAGIIGTVPTTNTAVAISLLNNGKVIIPNGLASNEAVNKGQLDLKANIAGQEFTGDISAPNLTGTNTGDLNENNVYLSHDFLTGSSDSFLSVFGISSGTIGAGTQTVNNIGVARITSSTTANSGAIARSTSTNIFIKGGEVFNEIINPLLFTNTTFRCGFHNTTSQVDTMNGIYFEYDGSANLVFKTANNGTRTTTSVATLSLSTWYKLRITVNSNATSVLGELFNASGVLIASATNTTNIPPNTRSLTVNSIVTNSGTTALNLLDLDFISVKTTVTR
jgi:hypothetical protein